MLCQHTLTAIHLHEKNCLLKHNTHVSIGKMLVMGGLTTTDIRSSDAIAAGSGKREASDKKDPRERGHLQGRKGQETVQVLHYETSTYDKLLTL